MACSSRLKSRTAVRRKLFTLRTLTNSKSVKMNSIIIDALVYIYRLELQLEAIKTQYLLLLNHIPKVKVEELSGKGFVVRVTCKKRKEMSIVPILEVFEEMGLNVVHARVCCDHFFFAMDAIVEAPEGRQAAINATAISHSLAKVIEKDAVN